MNTYKYRARPADGGKAVNGVVEAYSEFEAVAQIKARSLVVEKITEVTEGGKHINLNESLWVSDKVLSLTASQFAILLRAGLPMSRVVQLIADQTADTLMKRILNNCAADVAAGFSLAQSLEKNGEKIPATFIETVRAGEESGSLETCFSRLTEYYEKSSKVKRKVRSALTYPIALIILAVVVVAIVMVVMVPSMLNMYTSSGTELPLPTKMLMAISDFFVAYWPILLVFLLAAIVSYKIYSNTPTGSLRVGRLKMKMPIIGNISKMNSASQFANTLNILLTAGLPINQILTIIAKVMDNPAVGKTVEEGIAGLEAGQRLGRVLEGNEYLPAMLVEMVGVGEESGSLEETMRTIGGYYDEEANIAADKALGMLEPIITVVMGVMVGFIVIAIYAPMFTMNTLVAS